MCGVEGVGAVPAAEAEGLWLQATLTSVSGKCGQQQVQWLL